jgi:uncharacterized membrane protein
MTPATAPLVTKENNSSNLIRTFYGIGAVIAIIGVIILVQQNWTQIGFVGRIIVTLGVSFMTYVIGLLLRGPEQRTLSQIMFTISAALAPLGSYVLLKEMGIDFTLTTQCITGAVLIVIYASAFAISKRNMLFFLTVLFASWTYYTLLLKVFSLDTFGHEYNVFKWGTIVLGAAYILIGYGSLMAMPASDESDRREKKRVQNALYALGTLAILGGGITLGGIYDLILIIPLFFAFYGSVYLKSRSMLIIGALFLMGHIINLTSKYFVNSLGWPLALIGIGFLVIGVGYGTYYLNKRYIGAA